MGLNKKFYWSKTKHDDHNPEFIVMGCKDEEYTEKSIQAWIAPEIGSNLCRFTIGDINIIDFDTELLTNGKFTGTPVLYPTPNRVRNARFVYNSKAYYQQKNGNSVYSHGLVHDEKWDYSEPEIKDDRVSFRTWIDFNLDSPIFEAFPFEHRLELHFCLGLNGITVMYTIYNRGTSDIPYGFGLHPYFIKVSGDDRTYITLPARQVMDSTSDLLPTGKLTNVKGTAYDLRGRTETGKLDLDHVFTGITAGEYSKIFYQNHGIELTLKTSDDFSHLVIFTPKGKDFFCLENQTCSTDAHNLYNKGFQAESGLKFVPPGSSVSGYVIYEISRCLNSN